MDKNMKPEAGAPDVGAREHINAGGDKIYSMIDEIGEGDPLCTVNDDVNLDDTNFLSAVLDTIGALVLVLDIEGRIIRFNHACEDVSGYRFEELKGQFIWEALIRDEDVDEIRAYFQNILNGQYSRNYQNVLMSRSGGQRLISWTNTTLDDGSGRVVFVIATGIDITERKLTEQRLEYLAHFDSLTDLPNRTLFYDRLSHTLGQSRRYNQMFALLFIDLDGFKFVNDTLGHDMGDLLLKMAAKTLPECVRESDTVAHVGGDEFVVILPVISKARAASLVSQKIIEALAKPFYLDGHECFVGASIGISIYPTDGDDVDTLLKNSDIAMYQAKDQGRNNYQFYNSDMNTRALRRLKLENNLRKALEKNEFTLHYQPKVNLINGEFTGTEALVRWQNPHYGLVSPVEFIPLAEETGLIISIGEWVLRTACSQSVAWQKQGYGIITAVNLSARQFKSSGLIYTIESILQESGFNPEYLELELTESVVMEEAENAIKILRLIKNMGIHIAIDDFGMGYSSLSYLKRFPIDRLKIDKSFVRDITTDPDDEAIVTAIIAMAHSLKLHVTAEGVETVDQLEFLRTLNCDEAQGYLFSRPVEFESFKELLFKKH
ncbi:MAG: EAL domain-containing protein [Nitrospirae bacterium]|nr:EAL domain-containing protein [Nitrospirota bacterium]